jgi:hypothetical protein
VPNEPKEWETGFYRLLEEQELHCEQLSESSKLLRNALIKRQFSTARTHLVELQKLNNELSRFTLKTTISAREIGLLGSGEELKLTRLLVNETIISMPHLRQKLIDVAQAVQATAREAELNKRLFERLLDWNQKEARILTEPLTDRTGYGAMGSLKETKPRPAMLDRRG